MAGKKTRRSKIETIPRGVRLRLTRAWINNETTWMAAAIWYKIAIASNRKCQCLFTIVVFITQSIQY